MTSKLTEQLPTQSDMLLALQEFYPDSNHGAVAIDDRHEALQAYFAYEDDLLAAAPGAFDAYVHHQKFNIE